MWQFSSGYDQQRKRCSAIQCLFGWWVCAAETQWRGEHIESMQSQTLIVVMWLLPKRPKWINGVEARGNNNQSCCPPQPPLPLIWCRPVSREKRLQMNCFVCRNGRPSSTPSFVEWSRWLYILFLTPQGFNLESLLLFTSKLLHIYIKMCAFLQTPFYKRFWPFWSYLLSWIYQSKVP